MSKYPRIGEWFKCKPKGVCVVCGDIKADARATIQINNFRGDDEVFKVHAHCIKSDVGWDVVEAEYRDKIRTMMEDEV